MGTTSRAKGLDTALLLAAALACGAACAQTATAPDNMAPVKEQPAPEPGYGLPVAEIIGFDVLLNRFNHRFSGSHDYDVSFDTFRTNLRRSWIVDNDPFKVNQLGHPYQGSMYMGFARSSGLPFWPSMGLTFAGSIGWELAGENTRPSRNDQVASGIGGAFLGEALYRMANLMLENSSGAPSIWREVGAAVISPSNAFNRHVYGHGFGAVLNSREASYYSRAQFGVMGNTKNTTGFSLSHIRNDAQADFLLEYGLPGKEGYTYRQPFDYFSFQATASSTNIFENVMTRGLLWGTDYKAGKDYRGLWGLYGSYDYISPQSFRISTTAISLGTTGQYRASDEYMVQGSALAGVGYSAVGTINTSAPDDYHYGVTPQALVALRFIHKDQYAIDVTGREYFVSKASTGPGGHDNIARADVAFTWRIKGPHAVSVKYLWNRRDATSTALGNRHQTTGTIGVFYTLLGHDRFGAVDWK